MVLISVTHCANNCHLCTSDIKYNKIPCMFSTEFCNLKNYWAVPVADAYHKHGRPTWKVWTDDALNLWSSKDPQDFLHKSSSYWSILLDIIPLVQQPEAPTSILIQHQHRERRSYIATLWTMSYSNATCALPELLLGASWLENPLEQEPFWTAQCPVLSTPWSCHPSPWVDHGSPSFGWI